MIKNKKLAFGLFVVLFMAFWNLLDFIWTAVISGSSYHFSSGTDLAIPLILAIVMDRNRSSRGRNRRSGTVQR